MRSSINLLIGLMAIIAIISLFVFALTISR
jgi:hypothetical protein